MRIYSGRFVRIEDDSPCRLVRGGAERYTAPYADSFSIHMRASPSGKASASQADTRGFESRCPLQELQGTGDGAFSVSGPISGTRTRWGREAAGTRERSPASARGGRRPPEHAGAAGARESRCPLQELYGTGDGAFSVSGPISGTRTRWGREAAGTRERSPASARGGRRPPEHAGAAGARVPLPVPGTSRHRRPPCSRRSRSFFGTWHGIGVWGRVISNPVRRTNIALSGMSVWSASNRTKTGWTACIGGVPAPENDPGARFGGRWWPACRASGWRTAPGLPQTPIPCQVPKNECEPTAGGAMSPQMPVHVRLTRVPAHPCR